jgi:hypothetical protein
MALIHMIETEYPALWAGWRSQLEEWQHKQGLPPEWISEGRWRLREGFMDDEGSHY